MENYFGLVAAVVLVIVVAVAFAVASNRAEEERIASRQRGNKQKGSNKDKAKQNKNKKKDNKPAKNVVFRSDGRVENEDDSMVELIQGTAKYFAQEAKQASDAAAKKLQAAAAETKATADKAVKGAKNAAKKVQAAVEEQIEEGTYSTVSNTRNRKTKAESKEAVAGETESTPETGRRKKNKAFLKTELPPPKDPNAPKGQPGERRRKNKDNNGSDAAGDKTATPADGEAKPQRQPRNRPARDDSKEGDSNAVEGEEDRRPRQPRGPPKEPREPKERKPPVFQPLPVPLAATKDDVPSLDSVLNYYSTHFKPQPRQETIFSRLAQVNSQRIARKSSDNKKRAVVTLSGDQIIVRILSKLSVRDIVALSKVDQFFSKATRGDALWKSLAARDFGVTKEAKPADQKNNKSKDNNKKPRAKTVYLDKYYESKGRVRPTKAAKNNNNKSTDSPKAPKANESPKPEAKATATVAVDDASKSTTKKREKKQKDTA